LFSTIGSIIVSIIGSSMISNLRIIGSFSSMVSTIGSIISKLTGSSYIGFSI